MMRTALLQLNVTDDPTVNLPITLGMIRDAASQGAGFILTPEVTNCVSASRTQQNAVLQHQDEDQTLAAIREEAEKLGVWVLIGSIALKTNDADGRFANRSFLISPDGEIVAWYDKIHMFDVQVTETETYKESAGYRPGDRAVLAQTPFAKLGMTVCYDVRFPALHRALAQAGAEVLCVPAAFSPVTGAAHWEPLLRARAIENGCYVLAPAQCGNHTVSRGKPRATYGHSLVISPWGEVLSDAGTSAGITMVDLDLANVRQARERIGSLGHDRAYAAPV